MGTISISGNGNGHISFRPHQRMKILGDYHLCFYEREKHISFALSLTKSQIKKLPKRFASKYPCTISAKDQKNVWNIIRGYIAEHDCNLAISSEGWGFLSFDLYQVNFTRSCRATG